MGQRHRVQNTDGQRLSGGLSHCAVQQQYVEDTIFRSKAVGEPPLLLAFSVFFAIRDAIASVADYRVNPPLNAPATPEAILMAIQATRRDAA